MKPYIFLFLVLGCGHYAIAQDATMPQKQGATAPTKPVATENTRIDLSNDATNPSAVRRTTPTNSPQGSTPPSANLPENDATNPLAKRSPAAPVTPPATAKPAPTPPVAPAVQPPTADRRASEINAPQPKPQASGTPSSTQEQAVPQPKPQVSPPSNSTQSEGYAPPPKPQSGSSLDAPLNLQNNTYAVLAQPYNGVLTPEQQIVLANFTKLYKRVRVVTIDPTVFQSSLLTFNLFDDIHDTYTQKDIGHTGIDFPSWNGNFMANQGSVSCVLNGKRVSAHVSSLDYNIEISPLGMEQTSIHIIYEHDVNALNQLDKCPTEGNPNRGGSTDAPPYDGTPFGRIDDSNGGKNNSPNQTAANGYECFIRVLVPYTVAAKAQTLSAFSRTMNEHIALCMVQSNTGHANSGAEQRWELAYVYQIVGAERNVQDDDDMTLDIASLQGTTDGKWDDVHTKRSTYDADVITLMRIQEPQSGGTLFGLAYAFDYTSASNMFSLVSSNTSTTLFTFAHEIGHTMGCRHQNDGTTTPFAYGHAKCNASYRSILGTNSCGGTRLNFWSNPNLLDPNGVTLGTLNTAEVYRALNAGDYTVAHHDLAYTAAWTNSSPFFDITNDTQASTYTTSTLTMSNIISSGGVADIKSATLVRLSPGFSANAGSRARIYIQSTCTAEYSRTAENNDTPEELAHLKQSLAGASLVAFPNPFDRSTTIEYNLDSPQEVSLTLYNALGQAIQTLQPLQYKEAGSNRIVLDAQNYGNGIYYITMLSQNGRMTYKIVLSR